MIEALAIILGIIGIIGCFLPVLPGPPFSWLAIFILYLWGPEKVTIQTLIIWGVVALVVTILDYIVPAYFTRVTGGTDVAARGSLVGMVIGMVFFPPIGMIIGAFIGALVSEMLFNKRDVKPSFKSALGSLLGFFCGTFIKIIASGAMMFYIFKFCF